MNHSPYAVFPPTTSSFSDEPASKTPHMPVAVLGIAGYALIAILALFNRLWLTLQAAEIGFAFAAMLSYLEAYVMHKWCIYCVWSQGIITVLLLTTIIALILEHRRKRRFANSAVVVAE